MATNDKTIGVDDYKTASGEVWKFFKDYYDGNGSDDYWKSVLNESDTLAKKYKGTKLERYVSKYIVLCVGELNERQKDKAL